MFRSIGAADYNSLQHTQGITQLKKQYDHIILAST